jgi:hypothetical protein
MTDERPRRNGSTNGPTEPNQRPAERRAEPAQEAVKGPAVISEANARQRARDDRSPRRER